MAKIKSIKMKLELDSTKPYLETTVNICYDPTDRHTSNYSRKVPDKRFYIKLPQIVAAAVGKEDSRGNTQEEALKSFEDDLKSFRERKIEHNKVIIYTISITPDKTRSYNTGDGWGVNVWAETFDETVLTDGLGKKRYSYEKIESVLKYPGSISMGFRDAKRFDNQVPWTEQNEAFFLWVGDRLADLVARLAEIKTPEKLIETVNAGRLLPLGEGKNE